MALGAEWWPLEDRISESITNPVYRAQGRDVGTTDALMREANIPIAASDR